MVWHSPDSPIFRCPFRGAARVGDARRRTSHYHLPPFPPSIQYSMKKEKNKAIHASSYARQASVAGAIGVHYGRISHPGWRANQTLLPPKLCYAPLLAPIPIERKSSLVIPRLQHVRSFTRRCRRFFPAHAEPVNHRWYTNPAPGRSHINNSVRTHAPSGTS